MNDQEIFDVLSTVLPGKVFTPVAKTGEEEPYVIYQDTYSAPSNSMCGYQNLDEVHYQIDTYARTRREAKTLMSAVKAALRSSPLPPNVESEQSLYEADTRLNRQMIVIITWTQPEKVTA
jgi:hypothetical protein